MGKIMKSEGIENVIMDRVRENYIMGRVRDGVMEEGKVRMMEEEGD